MKIHVETESQKTDTVRNMIIAIVVNQYYRFYSTQIQAVISIGCGIFSYTQVKNSYSNDQSKYEKLERNKQEMINL